VTTESSPPTSVPAKPRPHPLRFHLPQLHLAAVFGTDWFGRKAEAFARLFGTPQFLVTQTIIVVSWIALNAAGVIDFDLYPFILLNLAFSLQAAYAAPLILLAQTRQADRDKALAEADAEHREALAAVNEQRHADATVQTATLLELMEHNTVLTEAVHALTQRIGVLTEEIHRRGVAAERA
jgi:uncharacterized membrane protein